jgi:hypothetical protein
MNESPRRADIALKPQERTALIEVLVALVEANEPSAVLASLQRIAERRAFGATVGRIERDEASRWTRLSEVLGEVREKLRDA